MRFITRLFRKKNANMHTENNPATMTDNLLNSIDYSDLPHVAESLFVNTPVEQTNSSEKRLKKFLETDHFRQGYSDGYAYHSAAICESYISSLKLEFEEMMEEEIEKLRMFKRQLIDHKITLQDMDPNLSDAITVKVDEVASQILRYEKYVLAVRDEQGIGAKPVVIYRDGFKKGMHVFVNEKLNQNPTYL